MPSENTSHYVGRFAPSPTGLLHFGSLVTALASYLDARHYGGQWLVRMEDLDPPREQPGAAAGIIQSLEDHGLYWDGELVYQSRRLPLYEQYLNALADKQLIYACDCTRQRLKELQGVYDGHCRARAVNTAEPHALRLKLYDLSADAPPIETEIGFSDIFQGLCKRDLRHDDGDQILKRKEGLIAYQLAVVVDDIAQGITHVIRGADLLEVTARQIFLYRLLGAQVPEFGHVPLAIHPNGQKLSKQNLAKPLESREACKNIWQALVFLRQNPPPELLFASRDELLAWALSHWQRSTLHGISAAVPNH